MATRGSMVALAVAFPAVVLGAIIVQYARKPKRVQSSSIAPTVEYDMHGDLSQVETFGAYVVRQLGLDKHTNVVDVLEHLAEDYLRTPHSNSLNLVESTIHLLLESDDGMTPSSQSEWKKLCRDIKAELDMCLYAYFGFNWDKSAAILTKVTQGRKSKWKNSVIRATQKIRFDKAMRDLGQVRQWNNLVEIAKAVQKPASDEMYTVNVAGQRPPVLLMIGGGMGAGKSTVVKDVISKRCFWRQAAKEAVVVEADAFKEKDVIYHALSSSALKDSADKVAQFVHDSSTHAAASLLVSALNSGRDVIFDGTMSWAPFVMQTVDMARNVHRTPYRIGPGYQVKADGSVLERYWEPLEDGDGPSNFQADFSLPRSAVEGGDATAASVEEEEEEEEAADANGGDGEREEENEIESFAVSSQENVYMRSKSSPVVMMGRAQAEEESLLSAGSRGRVGRGSSERISERKETAPPRFLPYHVEMVGVMCDPALAVMRGIRRAVFVGRGVPVESQLRSHRLFAQSLETYCDVVDQATVFSTNDMAGKGRVIAIKEKDSRLLIDPEEFPSLAMLKRMNEKARCAAEVYSTVRPMVTGGDKWTSTFSDPKRREMQADLGQRLSMFARSCKLDKGK